MQLQLKKDKNDRWGFVDIFKVYGYTTSQNVTRKRIDLKSIITPEGILSEPYVFRSGEFIKASTIDKEMGIGKYIKAKKPIYNLLTDGFLAFTSVMLVYKQGIWTLSPELSSFNIYKITDLKTSINEATATITMVNDLPEQMELVKSNIYNVISNTIDNRELFLKARFK